MKLLVLGDVMGSSGRKILKNKLPKIIAENKIDFVVVNGENAADDGRGITQLIAEEFFSNGVDVITSGNHIWDKQETSDYIENFKKAEEIIESQLRQKLISEEKLFRPPTYISVSSSIADRTALLSISVFPLNIWLNGFFNIFLL